MNKLLALALCLLLPLAAAANNADTDSRFVDPLDEPALLTSKTNAAPLQGVAAVNDRLVAVGGRGRVILSDDGGLSWRQVPTPVSADLTSVYFSTAHEGWAVGHDGVVLHTDDGGNSWHKQLDGRVISRLLVPYYQKRATTDSKAAAYLDEVTRLASEPPAYPLLDVWFRDDKEGFVVGAFNLILHTKDGGLTWEPWMDRTDNPRGYHLYSIRGSGDKLYVGGELGLLLKFDFATQRFIAIESPYNGTFFGLIVQGSEIIAFGLRGNAYMSRDDGQTWNKLSNPSESTLVSGTFTSDGAALLIDENGVLFKVAPMGTKLIGLPNQPPFAAFSITTIPSTRNLVMVGPAGARIVPYTGG